MIMNIESSEENFTLKKTPHRQLAYVESFKKFVSTHPHLILSFKKIEKEIESKVKENGVFVNGTFEEKDYKITAIDSTGSSEGQSGPLNAYFKVQAGGEIFFVKRIPGYFKQGRGVSEFASMQRAKELLKDLDNVEVVDFQFGYQDKKDATYFVSKWEEGELLEKYLERLLPTTSSKAGNTEISLIADHEYERIRKIRNEIIKKLFVEFKDVSAHNMIYCLNTKKVIVFDIHKRCVEE